jgi:flagellar protein FlgJ
MDISALTSQRTLDSVRSLSGGQNDAAKALTESDAAESPDLRKAFDSFVGETFYGQMLSAMRKTQHAPAYFDGGQAEKVFQQQLDQTLATKLAESSAGTFSGPMFELFQLNRVGSR